MSKGHINRRSAGWVFVVDLPGDQCQRCEDCAKRIWVEYGRTTDQCPCGGNFGAPHPERRQISRSGFRIRKQAEVALRSFQNWDPSRPAKFGHATFDPCSNVLACTTGLRRGEVLGLRWQDIDLDSGRLRVSKALQSVRDGNRSAVLRLVDPKTDRSRRTVALPEITVERLRLAKREQAERRLQAGTAWHDHDLVCHSGDGSPFHPDAFGKATKRLMKLAGLNPKTRLHDCRHAVATMMLEQRVHPAVASAVLGHSSVTFTMDTYQHVVDQMTDQAATALDDAFAAGISGPK